MQCKDAKRKLRAAQRQERTKDRQKTYNEIMKANSSDQKLFFKLINRQRSTTSQADVILKNGSLLTDDDDIRDAWRDYFHKLGTPDPNPQFDDSYLKQVEADIDVITQLNENSCEGSPVPITTEEVNQAIKQLNNGKAADDHGIQAEHIKKAGTALHGPLAHLYEICLSGYTFRHALMSHADIFDIDRGHIFRKHRHKNNKKVAVIYEKTVKNGRY